MSDKTPDFRNWAGDFAHQFRKLRSTPAPPSISSTRRLQRRWREWESSSCLSQAPMRIHPEHPLEAFGQLYFGRWEPEAPNVLPTEEGHGDPGGRHSRGNVLDGW